MNAVYGSPAKGVNNVPPPLARLLRGSWLGSCAEEALDGALPGLPLGFTVHLLDKVGHPLVPGTTNVGSHPIEQNFICGKDKKCHGLPGWGLGLGLDESCRAKPKSLEGVSGRGDNSCSS